MATPLCHCLTILWIWGCVLVSSDARVLSKSCNNAAESIALVNSSHLFGLLVECRDECVLFAVSGSSVEACKGASDGKEALNWKRCESSTASSLLVQSNDQHLCLLTTKQYLEEHSAPIAHHYVCANNEGCYSLLDAGGRHRREAAATADKHPVNSWITTVSSVAMIVLMLLLLVMCVGGNKQSPPPSTSNIPGNVAREGPNQVSIGVDSNQNNQKEIANQKQDSVVNMEPISGNQDQEVQVAVENQVSDQPAVSQEEQPQEVDQNHNQQNVNEDRDQQNDQNQAPQQAANPNQDVQAAAVNVNNAEPQVNVEDARVPYGVVTIHSDQSAPANDNYAEVRNVGMSSEPSVDEPEDLTYDRVVDGGSSTNDENGYSIVSRDQIAGGGGQRRPKRNNMYESVDEVLDREGPRTNDFPAVDDLLEQDDTYEKVPDSFREKVASFTQSSTAAPQLPPMHLRTRKTSEDNFSPPPGARSSATLPIMGSPKLSDMRKRLLSASSVNSKVPPPPSFPAPAAPPPSFPAPKPPTEDEEEEDELYARPELNPSNRAMSNPPGTGQVRVVQDETRKRAATLPTNANLGPLPEVPCVLPSTGEMEEEEPGYDTTANVMTVDPNYDHLNHADEGEVAEVQQEQQPAQEELLQQLEQQQQGDQQQQQQEDQQQQQQEDQQEEVEQSSTPSSVKRDGLGYALPSKNTVVKIAEPQQDKGEGYYASVNMTQKRLSQRKKQATAKVKAQVIATVSDEPPPLPPAIDLALVDDDIKTCPLTPPRLPESDELLVETESSEPPYARVNKPATSDLPPNKEKVDNDDVDPYATVAIAVTGRQQTIGLTMDREYDSIDNVMSPQEPFTVHISQIEGEYANVRSDATLHDGQATVMMQDNQGALSASQVPNDQTPDQESVNGQTHNQQTTLTPQQTTGEVPAENTN